MFSLNTWNLATVLELKKTQKKHTKKSPKNGGEKKKKKEKQIGQVIYFAITSVTFFFI